MKTDLPFNKCPRYSKCSVNNCPLHPAYPKLVVDDNDTDQKCKLSKARRVGIAAEFYAILKYGGLTTSEYRAKKVWDNLPEDVKEKRKIYASKLRQYIKVEEIPA